MTGWLALQILNFIVLKPGVTLAVLDHTHLSSLMQPPLVLQVPHKNALQAQHRHPSFGILHNLCRCV